MSAADQHTEHEYEGFRNALVKEEIEVVEKALPAKYPTKASRSTSSWCLVSRALSSLRFAQRKHADLLVVGASPRRFSIFDRVFPHDLEYIFAEATRLVIY